MILLTLVQFIKVEHDGNLEAQIFVLGEALGTALLVFISSSIIFQAFEQSVLFLTEFPCERIVLLAVAYFFLSHQFEEFFALLVIE